ncbi:hypothetical protein ACIP25_11560 [Streptomyces massasporeus]|uniref:hypothetical protein n=1 Tax=Streptomyces massasporeus TaxID=67324 RepID=UPI0037FF965C
MPKFKLTATSRTGQKVNPLGGSTDSVTVYSQADLDRRVKAAKTDPRDLDVQVERLS